MSNLIIEVNGLTVNFKSGQGEITAVNDVSFDLKRGETLGIVGESGSGKSVTALSIMRLIPCPPGEYQEGEILFNDKRVSRDLLKISEKEMRSLRGNRIGMIFQEPMTSLNPVYTCGRQVSEAIRLHQKKNRKEAREQALHWFREVKLPRPESIYRSYPHQLSGGQKQRVMIAMAICCNPDILIADEPTTALDVTIQKTILELIKELQQKFGMSVIFITHDLGVVAEIAQRVIVMYKGQIVEHGPVAQLFTNPQHPYTQGLIACRPQLHQKGDRLPTIGDFIRTDIEISKSPRRDNSRVVRTSRSARTGDEILIRVAGLRLHFPEKRNWLGQATAFVKAVDDVSFEIHQGETLGLVGESGCGKTTLGRSLLRLIRPDDGHILYRGKDLMKMGTAELRKLRKDIQIIFQDPYSSLSPRMMVGDALIEPLVVHRIGSTKKDRKRIVIEMLERVGLDESHFHRYPHEFSGGQRQRICIARALVLNPKFIVCDESVSALDVSVQAQVLNLLNDLKQDFGFTYLFISHDLSVVRYMSDRMIVMQSGKIVESGAAEQIYQTPQHPYTKQLIAAIPQYSPKS